MESLHRYLVSPEVVIEARSCQGAESTWDTFVEDAAEAGILLNEHGGIVKFYEDWGAKDLGPAEVYNEEDIPA